MTSFQVEIGSMEKEVPRSHRDPRGINIIIGEAISLPCDISLMLPPSERTECAHLIGRLVAAAAINTSRLEQQKQQQQRILLLLLGCANPLPRSSSAGITHTERIQQPQQSIALSPLG